MTGPANLMELAVSWITPLPDKKVSPVSFVYTVALPDATDITLLCVWAENFLSLLEHGNLGQREGFDEKQKDPVHCAIFSLHT